MSKQVQREYSKLKKTVTFEKINQIPVITERSRYISTLQFKKTDKIPFEPGKGRLSTLEAWHNQGLPSNITDYYTYLREILGIPVIGGEGQDHYVRSINFKMIPQFEEKVLETKEKSFIVQDWKGNICEISDQYDISYLNGQNEDFVTRRWIKCPVESREDWEDMKRRYDPNDLSRYPQDLENDEMCKANRIIVSALKFPGPFWQLREWLGFEKLCMSFIEDPKWVHEMVELWEHFIVQVLKNIFTRYVPDFIVLEEDMAYKQNAMISPQMCRDFLLPCWKSVVEVSKKAGVKVMEIDSDGFAEELIPVWLEAGFTSLSPMEIAAGNDIVKLREKFGENIAFRGGIDKRVIAQGGKAIKAEIDCLKPIIKQGGFIPSCDHPGVPPDISWPNFVEYSRLLAEATGWL